MLVGLLLGMLVVLWSTWAGAMPLAEPVRTEAAALCPRATAASPPKGLNPDGSRCTLIKEESGSEGSAEGVPTWGQPALSRDAILRLSWVAAEREVSDTAILVATDAYCAAARGSLVEPAPGAGEQKALAWPSLIERMVDPSRYAYRGVPPRGAASAMGSTSGFSAPWWCPLPVLPGLVAIVLSARELRRNGRCQVAFGA